MDPNSEPKNKRRFRRVIAFLLPLFFILLFVSIYLLINITAPIWTLEPVDDQTLEQFSEEFSGHSTGTSEKEFYPAYENINKIIIPKIGVDIQIFEGTESALEKGVWHRFPELGNPEKNGNFILTAHRFNIGFTPEMTKNNSPFYHIEKLEVGDEIGIIWNGKKYLYEVVDTFQVKPTQTEIENQTTEKIITLYSCTLGGRHDGREVIIAKPAITEKSI